MFKIDYSETVTQSATVQTKCPHCGFADTRRGSAATEARWRRTVGFSGDSARGRARDLANWRGSRMARFSARVARCGKCRRRSVPWLIAFWLDHFARGLLPGAVAFYLAFVMSVAGPVAVSIGLLTAALIGSWRFARDVKQTDFKVFYDSIGRTLKDPGELPIRRW